MISPYFKLGFECENTARELRRLERGRRPNLFLIEDGKKIIKNLKQFLLESDNIHYEKQVLYQKLILDDEINTKNSLEDVSQVVDSILEGEKPLKDYLKTSIAFFENMSDKCLSYANFDANTYN